MRIISPFNDYYDYLQAYGREPIVYNRTTQVFRKGPEVKDFSVVNFETYYTSLIGFCGIVIPRIELYHENKILLGDAAKEYILQPNYRRFHPEKHNLFRFLEDDSQQKIFLPLFKKYKVPVFQVYPNKLVYFNPNLGELRFDVYMEAGEAFQTLSSFIGTELKEKMELSPQTDREKVKSHGFDAKRSFRPKMK